MGGVGGIFGFFDSTSQEYVPEWRQKELNEKRQNEIAMIEAIVFNTHSHQNLTASLQLAHQLEPHKLTKIGEMHQKPNYGDNETSITKKETEDLLNRKMTRKLQRFQKDKDLRQDIEQRSEIYRSQTKYAESATSPTLYFVSPTPSSSFSF